MLTVQFTNPPEDIQSALASLSAIATPAFAVKTVATSLTDLIKLGFNDGEEPWGAPWAKPKYRPGQPLRDTGRLMNSIGFEMTGDEALVGTNVCYGMVHQFGAHIVAGKPSGNQVCGYKPKGAALLRWAVGGKWYSAKEVTIPARPFLPIRNSQVDLPVAWVEDILDALVAEFESIQ